MVDPMQETEPEIHSDTGGPGGFRVERMLQCGFDSGKKIMR
jgi:hypothetical protein